MPARMNKHARAAAERNQEKASAAASAKEKAEEDAAWADDGDKKMQKKAQRDAAKAEKAREKAASKEVASALEREREAKDAAKTPAKVSRAQIAKEMTKMRGGYGGGAKKEKDSKIVSEQAQEKMFEKHEDQLASDAAGADVHATGLKEASEALGRLAIAADKKVDEHPERRMKAAHLAYEEKNLPRLQAENPGLKRSQLKELCWKEWQKSPENPMVQAMQRKLAQMQ
eukprot:Hpha_TRINITY_DN12530_c0_g1::TRINITY_DN12530_c0_g1_i1::g.50974::m.50974